MTDRTPTDPTEPDRATERILKIEENKNKTTRHMNAPKSNPTQSTQSKAKQGKAKQDGGTAKGGDMIYNNNEKTLKDNKGIIYMSRSFRKALQYLGVDLTGRNLNQKDTILYIAEALGIGLRKTIPTGVIDYSKKPFKELKNYVFTQTTKKYEIEKQIGRASC